MATLQQFNPLKDIQDFNNKFGYDYEGKPRALTGELADLRRKLIIEEAQEYFDHQSALENERLEDEIDQANYTHLLSESFDGLLDVIYASLATALTHGFTPDMIVEGWRRVHHANMSKERSQRQEADNRGRGGMFDIVKPEGWKKPCLNDLVEDHDQCSKNG